MAKPIPSAQEPTMTHDELCAEDITRARALADRLLREAVGHPDSVIRQPKDMERTWAAFDAEHRAGAALTATAILRLIGHVTLADPSVLHVTRADAESIVQALDSYLRPEARRLLGLEPADG